MGQIGDQCIDRVRTGAPRAPRRAQRARYAMRPPCPNGADPGEFVGHMLIRIDDIVKRVGDLAGHTGVLHRHAQREIAFFSNHH